MAIPNQLADWTLETIQRIVREEYAESDLFDFKERLNVKAAPFNTRLRQTACSFANGRGGYLVFGVSEKGHGNDRLVGIPRSRENTKVLADKLGPVEPSLEFAVQEPPIDLGRNRDILVVEIARSTRGPHWDPQQRVFWRRDHSRAVQMSHLEVRNAFLEYSERVARIHLLYLSLIDNWVRLEEIVDPTTAEAIAIMHLDLTQVRRSLGEVQSLCPRLTADLLRILRECDRVEARNEYLLSLTGSPFAQRREEGLCHKREIHQVMGRVKPMLDSVLLGLQDQFGFEAVTVRPNEEPIPPVPAYWKH